MLDFLKKIFLGIVSIIKFFIKLYLVVFAITVIILLAQQIYPSVSSLFDKDASTGDPSLSQQIAEAFHPEQKPELPLEDAVYQALMQQEDSMNLTPYHITTTEFRSFWKDFLYEYPEIFFLKSYPTLYSADGEITDVLFTYRYTPEELGPIMAEYQAVIDTVVSQVNPQWTDAQKALFLHDYICLHAEYDQSLTLRSAYDILVSNIAVCQGYTLAYTALLKACGIQDDYFLAVGMNHVWNLVTIGTGQYHVDVTWGDPTADRLGRVTHDNFLRSDAAILENHDCAGEEKIGLCTSTAFDDWFWEDVDTAILPYGEDFYYIKNGTIYCWDTDKNSLNKCKTLTSKWYTNKQERHYWQNTNSDGSMNTNFSVFWPAGDVFLYNSTYSIKSFNPRTNELKTLYKYNGGNGCIFGFSYIDDTLTLQVGWDPNKELQVITVPNFHV